ncbi:hypothetical protein [Bacillus bingmayongensis]|uniref:hypothetical protein n=1 Tax=Bacillus bingmayongensis TaxID=1150157 RepID=UPI000380660E|nr:hypothetical protein [Bacillus bingmayongensis]
MRAVMKFNKKLQNTNCMVTTFRYQLDPLFTLNLCGVCVAMEPNHAISISGH